MCSCGLTETMSGGTIAHPDDRDIGNAGAPVACCQIKLVDEPEMGYTSNDKPRPRGQIYIGGENIKKNLKDWMNIQYSCILIEETSTEHLV